MPCSENGICVSCELTFTIKYAILNIYISGKQFFNHSVPYVQKEAGELAPSPLAETVKAYTAQLALPPRRGTRNPFMEEKVSKHRKYVTSGSDLL